MVKRFRAKNNLICAIHLKYWLNLFVKKYILIIPSFVSIGMLQYYMIQIYDMIWFLQSNFSPMNYHTNYPKVIRYINVTQEGIVATWRIFIGQLKFLQRESYSFSFGKSWTLKLLSFVSQIMAKTPIMAACDIQRV